MFLLSFVWGLAQLGLLAAGSLYLWNDYKHGFPRMKLLATRARDLIHTLPLLGGNGVASAEKTVARYGQSLGSLREAVATLEANHDQFARRACESRQIATEFGKVVEEALRAHDEHAAEVAAVAKVNAERRAELFEKNAQSQQDVARIMHERLDGVETEFEIIKTKADTIKVCAAVADANRRLYELISEVDPQRGLTANGEIETLLLRTEHEELKSMKLIEMAKPNGSSLREKYVRESSVQQALNEARDRLSLPAPGVPKTNGALEISED